MAEIGAYEAKTHLPQLLERVQKGERFVITKHGRPVAELVPVAAREVERIRRAIAELRRVRGGLARRGVKLRTILKKAESLRDLAHEDHRY
jgi:prevent-host-death family protein